MIEKFFNQQEKERIASAIATAEKQTSGEIRVHLDKTCAGDVLDRAAYVFAKLEMHKTTLRNGVLIYLSVQDKKLAIIGDKGINSKVPEDFWEQIKSNMISRFKEKQFAEGLCEAILKAGEQLKAHFPWDSADKNELSDEISYGSTKS